ncbi:MAG: WecB/TagA/CpsF family glycosyltransferase [Actinomycetota bacterium]
MKDAGKRSVLGILIDALDYEVATDRIISAAESRRSFAATALAVHGVMEGSRDDSLRYRLNHLDMVTPDGQPVRWALNQLYRTKLIDRVYGPTLMLRVCEAAASRGVPIYLYGSSERTVQALAGNLTAGFQGLKVAGAEPSKFRRVSVEEQREIAERIRQSGAGVLFVGLGCPRQEIFAYEYRDLIDLPIVAVGAAFDYHAGVLKEPPMWIQDRGLQWLNRLVQEPGRLWKRYLVMNTTYVALLILQRLGLYRVDPGSARAPERELMYG